MKWTKKKIMSTIMQKVDEKLQIVGVEHRNEWSYRSYVLIIYSESCPEPLSVIIDAHNISQKQYNVFRAVQAGLFVYLDDVADGDELLSRLIVHWFNNWDVWDDDIFSKTDKGILCPHVQGFDPFYTMYSIVTNMEFSRAQSSIRVGHID